MLLSYRSLVSLVGIEIEYGVIFVRRSIFYLLEEHNCLVVSGTIELRTFLIQNEGSTFEDFYEFFLRF